jgi:hypothetical protein
MGDSTQGNVLPGQVRGVKPGSGITIGNDGTISVNSSALTGVLKMGQTPEAAQNAYNGYNWPTSTGTPGQQLTINSVSGGVTSLSWTNSWTNKGQLRVATGSNTSALLDPGADGSFLVANSSGEKGLAYTDSLKGGALMPAGTTLERASSPSEGFLRYNTTLNTFEGYVDPTGSWYQIPFNRVVPDKANVTYSTNSTLPLITVCNNFTVNTGVTVEIRGTTFIYAQGNVTIDGTITGNEKGPLGAGSVSDLPLPLGSGVKSGADGNGLNSGSRGDGGIKSWTLTGSGGCGGFYAVVAGSQVQLSTGAGGNAGASLIIRALGSITVTGTINCNGGNGVVGSLGTANSPGQEVVISGSGGGSGGVVILHANENCTNTGTISAVGGNGGPAIGLTGWGGGGGGGGIIIAQSDYGVSTLGTTSVGGGTAGINSITLPPSNTIGAGAGGGCGGKGGNSGNDIDPSQPGESGLALTYGSPFI